eukprot:1446219-Amphidinium_carterae.1
MGTDRLRMNQRSNLLEQQEARAVEVEVLVSRERDSLHQELMRYLSATTLQGTGVTPPPPAPPPPVVPQQPMSASAVPQANPTPQVIPMAQQVASAPMQPQSHGTVPGYGIHA